ncbi:MAG: FAD:protein FMN transferase, partial [Anaerolineaceae bacterium]|nr:FAD:protein FMN transferase [Anaerolineaceae bacterium]
MITGEISFIAYDTVCRVQASADDEVSVEKALQEIRQSALEVESTLSMYDKNSELSRMNCSYVVDVPYPISSLLLASLPYNLTIAKMTEGAFDPTIGPLVRLWDFLNDEPKVPDYSTIEQVLKRVGYQHIHLDQKRKTITFSQSNMILDPGASGKGFALGLALDLLRKNKISHGVIDYGGNLYVHGGKIQTGAPLITAIRDPQETNSILGTVPLVDKAIATSSWYEHYFTIEGKVYHHIL